MTREKKEIVRKIAELDRKLGNGCGDALCEAMIDRLQEKLARLSHFDTYLDYVMYGMEKWKDYTGQREAVWGRDS